MAFIDFEKAFATVPRDKLWETLRDPAHRAPPPLITTLRSMHGQGTSTVRSQRTEKLFKVDAGVRQGGVLFASYLLYIW